ncbi:hypothetical protein AVO42_08090 [Thiomicrospira sp. XS5]|uniref:hypothetical protein n=1 Tax=Thiomicrospira sp. XS5 TaxID=1775636 RepID=UPI00074B17EF|nr:hypothetical protein [Thiomicrospira sp. XS5]KUJ75283.1 hypothetical protein AVO42_08090 [Thiomicrospira sp. XS5]
MFHAQKLKFLAREATQVIATPLCPQGDMDNYVNLNKVDIAIQQIERAINLFLDEQDYISSFTLAGAADEVLGKMVENEGLSSSYLGISALMNGIHKEMDREPYTNKEFNSLANGARNHLKHLSGSEIVRIDPRQEACNMLYRAICNFKVLKSEGTEKMDRWLKTDGISPAFKLKQA